MKGGQKRRRHIAALLLGCCMVASPSFAQVSQFFRPEQYWAQQAREQYANGHFDLAQQSAQLSLSHARNALDSVNARYFLTLGALRADTLTGLDSGVRFLNVAYARPLQDRVQQATAKSLFQKGRFREAAAAYEAAGIANFSDEELVDMRFEQAYCYFYDRQFDKALPLFASIRQAPGRYFAAGNYYYGLLAYNNGQYVAALESFRKVEAEARYRNLVPYYIAEIQYFSGQKKQALSAALELMKRPEKLFYDKELYLLAAQILYEEGRYGEALPYFENFYDRSDKIRKEELYEMAFSYYSVKEWAQAIQKFKQLNTTNDSLGQTAMYLLGDCYLKTGDKKSARNAFGLCAAMPYMVLQREASLLLHAKLSFDLGHDQDARQSLTTLIVEYPRSTHTSEARTLLSELLLKTRNYSGAYDMLQQAPIKDAAYWRVHQKVVYHLAIEQLQQARLAEADSLLLRSLQKGPDEAYQAGAYYWRGEIAMRRERYQDALGLFQKFVAAAQAPRPPSKEVTGGASLEAAWFSMGYASLYLEQYEDARTYFGKLKTGNVPGNGLAQTARVRAADASFMLREYADALAGYDAVIADGGEEAPYAKLQRAILLGVLGRKNDKIAQLQALTRGSEPYRIAVQARYELGVALIEDSRYQQAIRVLDTLTMDPKSGLGQKAWLRIGFAWQELNQDDKAITAYKHSVTDFPASAERAAALDALRSLYIERNQPEAYIRYVRDHGLHQEGDTGIASTYYNAAEVQFAAGKWAAAADGFKEYLAQFPSSPAALAAQYYLAESYYNLQQYAEAIQGYERVLDAPWNEFSEQSARRAISIANRVEQYPRILRIAHMMLQQAAEGPARKEALAYLASAAYALDSIRLSATYADSILQLSNLDSQQVAEAQFYVARGLQAQGKLAEAYQALKSLKNLRAASLASDRGYRMAEILKDQNKLSDAETTAAANLKTAAGSDYWTVKTYLLIADILVLQKDYFNARATLQSLLKNTKIIALKEVAAKKLEQLEQAEKTQRKLVDEE